MGVENFIVLIQVALYGLIFVQSLFVFIPLLVYDSQFGDHCLLYAGGEWLNTKNTTYPVMLHVHWGDSSMCNYSAAISIISLCLSFFCIVWFTTLLFQMSDQACLGLFCNLFVNTLMTFFFLISAATLSVGYRKWCDIIREQVPCGVGQYAPFGIEGVYDKSSYHVEFGLAQFGAWSSFVCWLAVLLMAVYKLWLYLHQGEFNPSSYRDQHRMGYQPHFTTPLI